MKKLFFVALVVAFGAVSSLLAADVKESVKAGAMAQGADIAGQAMEGKSAKEIADAKKEEAKGAAKQEAGKQINKFLNKF